MSDQDLDIENLESEGLRQVLENLTRRYWLLKQRAATQGISVDPAITMEIEALEKKIEEHRKRLEYTKNLNVAKGDSEPLLSDEMTYGLGKHWAVLVGVNQYDDSFYPGLHVCVKDVESLHKQLTVGGFDPTYMHMLTDNTDLLPTRAEIFDALKRSAKAALHDDLLFFYYSGHGDRSNDTSYLIARDSKPNSLEYTAVALPEVANILRESEARAKVIILDACHSGASFDGKGPKSMPPDFIKRVFEQARGQVVLASCKQGELSYEWQAQERSVFTHFLLQALKGEADYDEKGFVTVQDVNRYVVDGVRTWGFNQHRSQTPNFQGVMAGDIVLVKL
jgi:hypothetical protein